jgi:molecular chaperone Hsp33
MNDYLIRGITKNKFILFFAVNAKETVEEAIKIHNLSFTNAVLLGRTLIAGLLISNDLKNKDDLLTLRFDGNGSSGSIIVTATGEKTVKGYIQNPENEISKDTNGIISFKNAVGEGILHVIKSIGDQKPYIGQTQIVSGEIAEDIAFYYMQSEQIPTAIQLGVLLNQDASVRQAGGFFIQLLPNTPEDIIDLLEKNIQSFPNFSDMLDLNYSIETLIEKFILKNFEIDILDKTSVKYQCNCSRERFYNGIVLLGNNEIENLINENESISAECHFCNKSYTFNKEDLISMLT